MKLEKLRNPLRITLMCLMLIALILCFMDDAYAATKVKLSEKKGIAGLFKGKMGGEVDSRAPSRAKKGLAIGSFVVMFIALKYL